MTVIRASDASGRGAMRSRGFAGPDGCGGGVASRSATSPPSTPTYAVPSGPIDTGA